MTEKNENFIELKIPPKLSRASHYEKFLFTIKTLLSEKGYENLESFDLKILNYYKNILIEAFPKLDEKTLENLFYMFNQINNRLHTLDNSNNFILIDFLKFLEEFSHKCNKEKSLFYNFKKTFKNYKIANTEFIVQIYFDFLFLGNQYEDITFYILSIFTAYRKEYYEKNKYFSFINDKILGFYIVKLFNKYKIKNKSFILNKKTFKEVITSLYSKINAINGCIENNFINSENIDHFLIIFLIFNCQPNKILYIKKINSEYLFYLSLIFVLNANKILRIKINTFVNFDLRWNIDKNTKPINMKKELRYFKYDFFNIIGGIKKVPLYFVFPSYSFVFENNNCHITKTNDGIIYTHLTNNENEFDKSSSKIGISPFSGRIKNSTASDNKDRLNGKNTHVNKNILNFEE